jgi:hypothetical protein
MPGSGRPGCAGCIVRRVPGTPQSARTRHGIRRLILAAAVTAAVGAGSASGGPESVPAPKASKPLTIQYTGSFRMTNRAVPESTAHSYAFLVTWTYWWTGTWGGLFRDPTIYRSSPSRFTKVEIVGTVHATHKERVDDTAIKSCSMQIVRDNANRPTVAAAYDTSADSLQVVVEAPMFRGLKYVPAANPGCRGGPGVNVLGPGASRRPPASFNPLGQGGTVRLTTGGTRRYEKTWSWKHTYASATNPVPYRTYKATIRSEVTVAYTPCRLIPACATAKR